MQDLVALPKAHLHLHLTGSMRPATLVDLASEQGRALPSALLDPAGAQVDVTGLRGWSRFQRLYDAAREVLVGPAEVRRVVRELVEDEAAAGSAWVELQVDPTTYAPRLGGLQAVVELVLDALSAASAVTGVGTALVVAANRTRPPAEAEALARLARRFAGRGVVGFGLSNDETRGPALDFTKAFRLAREVGLVSVPHAGELRGPRSVREAVEHLGARRVGHGVRAAEDPDLLELMARLGVVAEVCPASNVSLGVLPSVASVPVVALRAAGVEVALGADDPLLFRSGLLEQYDAVRRAFDLTPVAVADLAACSVRASCAPDSLKASLLAAIAAWPSTAPTPTPPPPAHDQYGARP